MELIQLEYFLSIVENSSFRRAAEDLHVAQPALSRQIKKLERELGTELLVRSNHGVTATQAGIAFVAHAQEILALVGASRSVVAFDNVFDLGISTGLGERLVALLTALAQRFPELDTRLHRMGQMERIAAVRSGAIHGALLRGNPAERYCDISSEIRSQQLWTEDLVIATAFREDGSEPAHTGNSSTIPIEILAGKTLLIMPKDVNPPIHDATMQACENAGFTPLISDNSDSIETLLARISSNSNLWSVVYESAADSIRSRSVLFQRPVPSITVPTFMIRRSVTPSEEVSAILDYAASVLPQK